jgi:hypothetical protein
MEHDEIKAIIERAVTAANEDRPHVCTQATDIKLMLHQQGQMLELLRKHDTALYGNGKPGLIAQVSELVKDNTKTSSLWQDVTKWVVIAALSALITLIATHGITP